LITIDPAHPDLALPERHRSTRDDCRDGAGPAPGLPDRCRKALAWKSRVSNRVLAWAACYPDTPAEVAFLNANGPSDLERAARILRVARPEGGC
jgi:hypothetical protein